MYTDTFITENSNKDVVFGPDDNLYIASNEPCYPCADPFVGEGGRIMRFNSATGAYIDTPFPVSYLGLYDPNGLTIGSDGNIDEPPAATIKIYPKL